MKPCTVELANLHAIAFIDLQHSQFLALLQVAKNITLAGVGHVTIMDATPAAQLAGHNFLITPASAGEQT
jgi:hypothetical protein